MKSLQRGLLMALLVLFSVGWASALDAGQRYREGELLVIMDPGQKAQAMQAMKAAGQQVQPGRVKQKLMKGEFRRTELQAGENVESAMRQLQAQPGILHVQPNYLYKKAQTPSDPMFSSQDFHQTIGSPPGWDRTVGDTSIRIAVLDTGIDTDHVDIDTRLLTVPGSDIVDGDSDPNDEKDGHGTLVAGVSGAIWNDTYIPGIDRHARIMPVRVLDSSGVGTTNDLVEGIDLARNNGADIINMSLAFDGEDAILKNALSTARDSGIINVAASGNDSNDRVSFPARYSSVIAVGATNGDSDLASFSNEGRNQELVAPGQSILTLYPEPKGSTTIKDGTSLSSPMVASGASLALSIDTSLRNEQIRNLMSVTATDLGPSGWDERFGYGRLDLDRLTEWTGMCNTNYPEVTGIDAADTIASSDTHISVGFPGDSSNSFRQISFNQCELTPGSLPEATTESGTKPNYEVRSSLLNKHDTLTISLWTNQPRLAVLGGIRNDTSTLSSSHFPPGIEPSDRGRQALAGSAILLEFANTFGRSLGDSVTTTEISDTVSYALTYDLSETTASHYYEMGFDTAPGSNDFAYYFADTYGDVWNHDSKARVSVLSGEGDRVTIRVTNLTRDLPGVLAGNPSTSGSSSGGGGCLIERMGLPGPIEQTLRSTRDTLLQTAWGRTAVHFYYYLSL